ncbi:hypothetical protein [Streptomyces acidiscabies]|uniref:Uncharacterized protein n=1 Tax=Streptomyces acidiscabies TaxID=42234 RepID=A0A0L0K227_9ACTN|nr:hypothetical protein [Streptomyces acidiscabies]KND32117.1 hypothetical protein IQ63_24100 [Streptomyces acidiscabies]
MPISNVARRPKLKSAVLASFAALGLTLAAAGTASANAQWEVQLINANMPTGTGSVKVVYSASGQTVCVKPNTASKTTDAGVQNRWGNVLTVSAHGDSSCQGSSLSSVTYKFAQNDDVAENNLNCTTVAVGVKTAEHHFRLCG